MRQCFFFLLIITYAISINSQPNPDSLAAKYCEVINAKSTYENRMALLIAEYYQSDDESSQMLRNFMWEHFSFDSLKNAYINIYKEAYTPEELSKMIEFFSTPLGQKIVNKESIVSAKLFRATRDQLVKKRDVLDSLSYLAYMRDTTYIPEYDEEENAAVDSAMEEYVKRKRQETDSISAEVFENSELCLSMHEGRFRVKENYDYIIERKDGIQHEICEAFNSDGEYKVEWLSDCEYNLTFIKDKNKKMRAYKEGDVINVIITDVRKNEYDCVTNFKGIKNKITVIKKN